MTLEIDLKLTGVGRAQKAADGKSRAVAKKSILWPSLVEPDLICMMNDW